MIKTLILGSGYDERMKKVEGGFVFRDCVLYLWYKLITI